MASAVAVAIFGGQHRADQASASVAVGGRAASRVWDEKDGWGEF
jgi:hypothetical protein